MERKAVLKWTKIFSATFYILSIVELIDLIYFSSLINLNLDYSQYSIISVIFQSGFMAVHAMLLWVVLLFVICSFIVLSFSIFRVAKKNKIENLTLAKFLLLIGLFLIIGGFIKTNFFVLLGNSNLNTITPITLPIGLDPTLQNVINFQSLIGAIMWTYFTVVTSCFLISGLIFGGIGLKWMLLIQEEETSNK